MLLRYSSTREIFRRITSHKRITNANYSKKSKIDDDSDKYNYGDDPIKSRIGNREIVCHGMNGEPEYIENESFPFPAIRYRECTPELMAMREKERGDWRNLSCEEKKYLYRASFRQTFAELQEKPRRYKFILGFVLMGLSVSILCYLGINKYVLKHPYPISFHPQNRINMYYKMVEINNQPFSGNWRPPGAEKRVHPKNAEMLKEIEEAEKKKK